MNTPEALVVLTTRRLRLVVRLPHIIATKETFCIEGNTEVRVTRYPFCLTAVFCFHGFGFGFDYHDGSMQWNNTTVE